MTITIEPILGDHIAKAAERLVKAARESGDTARMEFNDIEVFALPDSSPGDIAAYYDAECDRRAKAHRESPEGIEAEARNRREVAALQARCDEMFMHLPYLDFADRSAVLAWLCEFQPISDRAGVEIPTRHIVETFDHHGYKANACAGKNFRPDDRENVARYIVGQAMDNLMRVGAIHPMVRKFADDWRKKFEPPRGA